MYLEVFKLSEKLLNQEYDGIEDIEVIRLRPDIEETIVYTPLEVLENYKEYFEKQIGQKNPCSNQIVLCGIVTPDKNKAINFMKDKNIIYKKEGRNEIIWFLDNGEKWMWQNWNINHRGYRFYKIAVDKFIEWKLFQLLVVPKCALYCCSFEII